MKRLYKIILLCFVLTLIFFRFSAFSQDLSVKLLPGEQKVFEQAVSDFENESYLPAKEHFSQLLSLYPREIYFNYAYGACLVCLNMEFAKSIDYLEYALDGGYYQANYFIGMAYHLRYMFDNAIRYYEDYQERATGKDIKLLPVDRQIKMAKNGIDLIKYSYDLQVIETKNVKSENFYYSYNAASETGEIVVIPKEFKSKFDKKKNYNGLMYVSKLYNIAFFSSYGNDRKSNLDIYMVVKDGNSWSNPIRLPDIVNSAEDEAYPFFHPNGEYLYFSSKGHNSMGGYDIFKAAYNRQTGQWSKPQNLDFPINTPLEDIMYVTDERDLTAYFASTRETEAGRIDVYQILVEQNPAQRQIVNIDDMRRTSHLQTNPIAVKEFEKRYQELMAINNDTNTAYNNNVPDESNGLAKDTVMSFVFIDQLEVANNNIDSLNKSIDKFKEINEMSIAQMQYYIEKIEQLEAQKQQVVKQNISSDEKEKQIDNIDENIYAYIDSLAVLNSITHEYTATIDELNQKVKTYEARATDIETNYQSDRENVSSLDSINAGLEIAISIKPEAEYLKDMQQTVDSNRRKIEKTNDELILVEKRVSEIDKKITDLNDSLMKSDDPQKQIKIEKEIETLYSERNKLIVEYKEKYLQQEFLINQTVQLEKDISLAETFFTDSERINKPNYSISSDVVINKAEKYIERHKQKNLKDLANIQIQILDSVFFDNSSSVNERILTENNSINQKTQTEKTNTHQIHELSQNPLFEDSEVNKYLAEADSLVNELEETQKQLAAEKDYLKRKEILADYTETKAKLDTVYSNINKEISEVNKDIIVDNVTTLNVDDIRGSTENEIALQKEKGLTNDVILAEDYLYTADSLYALAANTDNKIPAMQDYYLKEAIIYENKAYEITHNTLVDNTLNNNNQIHENDTVQSDTVNQNNSIADSMIAEREKLVAETKQQIVDIEKQQANDTNIDSLWSKAITGYETLEDINSTYNKTKNEGKKADLLRDAINTYNETRAMHARVSEQKLNKNLDEFYLIDKSFEIISNDSNNNQLPAARDYRNKALELHKQAGNKLIAAEETNNDSLRNELIIEASNLEAKAVTEYKRAFEIAADTNIFVYTEQPENIVIAENTTIDTIINNYYDIINTNALSNSELNITNESEWKTQQVDSLIDAAVNVNLQIASLQDEYDKTLTPAEKDSLINVIDSMQKKQEALVNTAYNLLVDMQQEQIIKNRELIASNKNLYKEKEQLYIEIENDFNNYKKAINNNTRREEENYFFILQEIVIMGDSLLIKQQKLMAENTPNSSNFAERIVDIGRKTLLANNWISENQKQLNENKNSRQELLTGNSEKQNIHNRNKELMFAENAEIISNNTEINNLTARSDSAMNEALEIKNDLKANYSTYSDFQFEKQLSKADSLENMALKLQNEAIKSIEEEKQLIAVQDENNQQKTNEIAWNNSYNSNRNILYTINHENNEIDAAVQRTNIIADSLMNQANEIRKEIQRNTGTYSENEIKRMQLKADSLTIKSIDMQTNALAFANNNDVQAARIMNSEYRELSISQPPDNIVLSYSPIRSENLIPLPENDFEVDTNTIGFEEKTQIDTLVKERVDTRDKINKIDVQIALIQDSISKTNDNLEKRNLIEKRNQILAEREKLINEYYKLNDNILNIAIASLEAKQKNTITDFEENRYFADSLTNAARLKEQEAETLRLKALNNYSNTGENIELLAKANELEKEALSNRSEAVRTLDSNESVRPKHDIVDNEIKPNSSNSSENDTVQNILVFRIQFAAYNRIVGPEYTKGLAPIFTENVQGKQLIRYMAGEFSSFESATKELPNVKNLGFKDAFIVAYLNGNRVTIFEANKYLAQQKTENKDVIAVNNVSLENEEIKRDTADKTNKQYGVKNIKDVTGVFLTVQFAAAKRVLLPGEIYGIQADYIEILDNGYIRHLSGKFYTMNDAVALRNRIRTAGAGDAFITAYNNGVRIPVNEALQLISTQPKTTTDTVIPNNQRVIENNANNQNENFVIEIYVQIGAYRNTVNDEIYRLFESIAGSNNIKTVQNNNLIIYRIGPLQTKLIANEVRKKAIEAGITDAFIIAYKNGKQIPLNEITE